MSSKELAPRYFELYRVPGHNILTSNGYIPVGELRRGMRVATATKEFPEKGSITFKVLENMKTGSPVEVSGLSLAGPGHPETYFPYGASVYGSRTLRSIATREVVSFNKAATKGKSFAERFTEAGDHNVLAPVIHSGIIDSSHPLDPDTREQAQAFMCRVFGLMRIGPVIGFSIRNKDIASAIRLIYDPENIVQDKYGLTFVRPHTDNFRTALSGGIRSEYSAGVSSLVSGVLRISEEINFNLTLTPCEFAMLSFISAGSGFLVMKRFMRSGKIVAFIKGSTKSKYKPAHLDRVTVVCRRNKFNNVLNPLYIDDSFNNIIINNFLWKK